MENSSDESMNTNQVSGKKGGLRMMPFIIANESFEKVASYGLLANMVLYLTKGYNLEIVSAASIIFTWSATTNFMPLIGAFISDSYLGRFGTIVLGSISSLLGMFLLWLTAEVPGARPPNCIPSQHPCKQPTATQMALLLSSFVLMSVGAGGIRTCSIAFGAEQLDQNKIKRDRTILQSFFNWYYVSVGISIMLSVTVIVYIQDNKGWNWGFRVPVILMFFSALLFILGSSFYIKRKADSSIFIGFAMVIVAAIRNRHLALPPKNADSWFHQNASKLASPTNKLRLLNKACMIRNPETDLNSDGSASNPWKLCTVEQVEELKLLIKVIPIWTCGIMIAITNNQHSFPVLQANTMDRHLGPNFQIPAGSFTVFTTLTLTVWIAVYDRMIVPAVCKLTGKVECSLTLKQRIGIGLLISCAAMVVSAIVERARRKTAIGQGLRENGHGLVDMSAMWIVPQYCLIGLAEAFNSIGQIEYYYSQFPKSMASIGVALFTLGSAVGNLMGSLLLKTVDWITRRSGKESWVSNNLNSGHYDYYYWLLAGLSLINFGFYVVCSWAYRAMEGTNGFMEEKREEEELEELPTI